MSTGRRKHMHSSLQSGSELVKFAYGAIEIQDVENNKLAKEDLKIDNDHSSGQTLRDQATVIANTLNALLGVALFAMPWGFQQSGVYGGSLILSAVAFISYDTARILLVSQQVLFKETGEVKGYPEMASKVLGPNWSYVVQTATVISCLGGCTGYIIFFGQTLGQAFGAPAEKVILLATIPLILLSWIRSFKELTLFTVFGVFALACSVFILLVDGSASMRDVASTPLVLPGTILNFVGPATFLFTIHYCVISIGAEFLRSKPWLALADGESDLPNSNHHRTSSAFRGLANSIAVSYLLAFIVIATVGCFGYIMYRNSPLVRDSLGNIVGGCELSVCQNVILNISPGFMRNVVGVSMSMVIILSYLVILAPAREHIEGFMLSYMGTECSDLSKNISMNLLRTALVLCNVFVAVRAPYFSGVLGAVGGLTDALLCFVLPPLIYRAVMKGDLSSATNIMYIGVTICGVIIIAYTFTNLVKSFAA